MGYTWDDIYDELKVPYGGLPGRSTQDMLQLFWEAAGYTDGDLGADEKVAFYISQGAIGDTLGDLEHDYWHRVGANLLAAKGAVFAIDATQSVDGEQWVLNRGSGGQVLRAKYGSVARAEIRRGVGLVGVGSGTNGASVPDAADLDMTTGVEIYVRFDVPAVTGVEQQIVSKGSNYSLAFNTSGLLRFYSNSQANTLAHSLTPGTSVWMKAVHTQATGLVDISWAPDNQNVPTSWTVIGQINNTTAATLNNNDPLGLGGSPYGSLNFGSVLKRAIVAPLGGATVVDVDFTTQPDLTTSFTATTGQTVTVTAANAVDTNDPLWLNHTGENYLHVPAVGGNVAQVSDSAALDITGDMEVVCRATAPPDTAATSRIFMNKSNSVSSEYSWNFETYAGNLYFIVTSGGTSATQQFGQAVIPVPLGLVYWWKATFNAALGRVQFFYAPDSPTEPTSWTAITNVRADFGAFTIYAGTAPLGVGASGTGGNNLSGNMYRAIIRNGIGGTTVFDANFTTNTQHASFVCSTGQTVSLIRSSVGRKLVMVTRPVWLFGTDDYMEVADNDLLDFGASQDFTLVAVVRDWANDVTLSPFMAKKAVPYSPATEIGWHFGRNIGDAASSISDGTTLSARDIPMVVGQRSVFSAVRSGSTLSVYRDNTSASLASISGSLSNALAMRIGAVSAAAFANAEIMAVGIFRRALSAAEIAQIVTYYGAA